MSLYRKEGKKAQVTCIIARSRASPFSTHCFTERNLVDTLSAVVDAAPAAPAAPASSACAAPSGPAAKQQCVAVSCPTAPKCAKRAIGRSTRRSVAQHQRNDHLLDHAPPICIGKHSRIITRSTDSPSLLFVPRRHCSTQFVCRSLRAFP